MILPLMAYIKVMVTFLSTLIIKINQVFNMLITVAFPNLSLRWLMRSLQVQMYKKFLLQLVLKLIHTHQFNMIN